MSTSCHRVRARKLMIPGTSAAQSRPVELWITSFDKAGVVAGFKEQPNLAFSANPKDTSPAIEMEGRNPYQQREGDGAAFTDAGAWLIGEKLVPAQREKVMGRFFDPIGGIGLGFLRTLIEASDLTRDWYTYDDGANDRSDPSLPQRNRNGALVLIACNNTTTAQKFKILWRSESFHDALPVNTSATFSTE